MSEHVPSHEIHHNKERQVNPYGERVAPAPAEAPTHHAEHGRHQHEIEQLIKKIEQHAPSAEVLQQKHIEQSRVEQQQHTSGGSHIQSHGSSKQTLKNVQKQLSGPQRQFSKVIHNTAVESVSEAAGNTIARPSGLLTAGVFSLVASIGVLIVCRFYGYEYNYGIGLMFMAAGFVFGLFVELLLKARPTRNR